MNLLRCAVLCCAVLDAGDSSRDHACGTFKGWGLNKSIAGVLVLGSELESARS